MWLLGGDSRDFCGLGKFHFLMVPCEALFDDFGFMWMIAYVIVNKEYLL